MARRTIHFSDLTSQPILDDADVVRVVVHDHPALGGDAVEFEAAASELTDIDKGALDVVVIELHPAAEEPARRVILDVATFDKLAVGQPMDEVLRNATPTRSVGRAERAPASRGNVRANYATLEHAGTPHKGKVTEAEALLVRENLDVINARLLAAGQRAIDPADPAMRERYGFGATEDEAEGVAGPKDAATPLAHEATPSDEATPSEPDAEPKATASTQETSTQETSTQGNSAASSATGRRRSSTGTTKPAPGAAST